MNTQPQRQLTQNELDIFNREGYLRIEQAIPPGLLLRLQQLFQQLTETEQNNTELVQFRKNGKLYTSNIELVCNKGSLEVLELLAHPFILHIAETICGHDFFPVQDFAVIKMLGSDDKVLWHLDMQNRRSAPSFTMGIYLDDASEQEGALRVVPRSHTSGKDICTLARETSVAVAAKAGDMIIHDMLTAHCSGVLTHNSIRRVIYFEFLSPQLVREEAIYTEELITRRTRLIAAALKHYRQQHPQAHCFEWRHSRAAELALQGPVRHALDIIYRTPVHARPSDYCFDAPVV